MQVLRKQQWLALVLLTAGVGLVQYHEAGMAVAGVAMGSTEPGGVSSAVAIGAAAVLASSLLSGFAVREFLEHTLKRRIFGARWRATLSYAHASLFVRAECVF